MEPVQPAAVLILPCPRATRVLRVNNHALLEGVVVKDRPALSRGDETEISNLPLPGETGLDLPTRSAVLGSQERPHRPDNPQVPRIGRHDLTDHLIVLP